MAETMEASHLPMGMHMNRLTEYEQKLITLLEVTEAMYEDSPGLVKLLASSRETIERMGTERLACFEAAKDALATATKAVEQAQLANGTAAEAVAFAKDIL